MNVVFLLVDFVQFYTGAALFSVAFFRLFSLVFAVRFKRQLFV